MEIKNLRVELGENSFTRASSLAIVSALLASGCSVQVALPSAQAAPQSLSENASLEELGGLEPGSDIQNQLMHSYTHDSMSDFIMTNTGTQRRGF